jgi:tetratricopeptide (TPR) repeat protein
VLHNLHHFKAAESVARRLVDERGAPTDWALLSDVLIEQGRTTEGAAALQAMVSLKPGAEAYSRIAYVRWLKGDRAGAVASLEMAFRSTHVRDAETRAWVLSRLSFLHLQLGDSGLALERAQQADRLAADYPPALLARGRALVALERWEEAIAPLAQAEQLQPLPEYQWWLADVLRATGREQEALRVEDRLKRHGAENDRRTFVLFLATRGEATERAIRLAESELTERGDAFTHDALAWALLTAGQIEQAREHLPPMIAGSACDARVSWHAGEIELAAGNVQSAERHFSEARALAGALTPSERALLARRATATDLAAR